MNFQYYIEQFALGNKFNFLPIDKIDGVCITICIEEGYQCNQGCKCMKCPLYFRFDYTNMESKSLREGVNNQEEFENMIKKIRNLKFDKLNNKLTDKPQPTIEFYSCLVSPNITLYYDECCVCLETTSGKTCCNHPICLACITNLKKARCPLCRAEIFEDNLSDE